MATTPLPSRPPGEPPSQIQTAPNLVRFDPRAVVPSQTLYLQRNDYLGFYFLTNLNAAVVRIKYRWLTPDGEIKEGELDTAPFNLGTFVSVPLYEGWLLSITASVTSAAPTGFFCFMQATIFRAQPNPGGIVASAIYWQGFLPVLAGNGWPGTPPKEITDGVGVIRSITGSTPAAGAEISEIVPSQRRWILLSVRATLTTSATVANRLPGFLIDDGINTLFSVRTNVNLAASSAMNFHISPGSQFFNDGAQETLLPFPNLLALKTNFHIKSNTTAIQATDQWSAPQYEVLEWGLWDS